MATLADLLQARAALAEVETRVQQASAGVQDAREALGNHLGWEAGRVPVPVEDASVLHARMTPPSGMQGDSPDLRDRADLVAGRAGVEAAQADVRALEAARLPAVQAFGMLSTHAPGLTDRREANWTMGLRLSIPVFTGFQLSRGAEAARAGARALELEHQQREREALTGLRSALRATEAARGALASARSASEAADEALRLLTRRYEEGMATVSDLLQAEARAVHLRTGVVAAEADLGIALAALEFTRGQVTTQHPSDHEASDHE
jgi:outer membrane protein TolC